MEYVSQIAKRGECKSLEIKEYDFGNGSNISLREALSKLLIIAVQVAQGRWVTVIAILLSFYLHFTLLMSLQKEMFFLFSLIRMTTL